jgi:hypothetical protein
MTIASDRAVPSNLSAVVVSLTTSFLNNQHPWVSLQSSRPLNRLLQAPVSPLHSSLMASTALLPSRRPGPQVLLQPFRVLDPRGEYCNCLCYMTEFNI